MRLYTVFAVVALAVSPAGAQVLIGNNPNVSNGGLNALPGPGDWVKTEIIAGPNARVENDRAGPDGGDWAIGGSDGTGCSPDYEVYYSQTFEVGTDIPASGEYLVNLSGWAKAWAGWWGGEDFGWQQESHIELWVDGIQVADMMSSNNTNRDVWAFWSWLDTVTINTNIEVRLRAVKGPGTFNPGGVCGGQPYSAIFFDSRFDDITLEIAAAVECTNPSTITGVDPDTLEFTLESPQIITVQGTNLEEVTGVRLIGPVTLNGVVTGTPTNEAVSAAFDLSGAKPGLYDVQVLRSLPCANITAPGLLTITPGPFLNGSFELGDPNDQSDIPYWTFLVDRAGPVILKRSGEDVFGATAAPFDGDFYGGNSWGGNGNFHVALAQTFKTSPGVTYRVSGGHFGGATREPPGQGVDGLAWWEVLIVDGVTQDMNSPGTLIAKRERPLGGGYIEFREALDQAPIYNGGEFTAGSDAATVFLKWGHNEGTYSINMAGWDALEITSSCNPVWADADGDGDVDHDDFAFFQRCYTGPSGAIPAFEDGYPCACFDRAAPLGQIGEADFNAFVDCVSGPSVPISSCP